MKKLVIILFLFTLLFVSSCAKETVIKESSFCKKPYFEFKKGECCLDNNNNSICDIDEVKEKKVVEEVKEEVKEEVVIEKESEITQPELVEEAYYNLPIGDTAKFNKIEIKLLELVIGTNIYSVFDVGGKKTTVFGTKNLDIIGDISLYIDSITGVGDDLSVSIVVKKYELEPDHYIVKYADVLNIGGKEIYVSDILKEKEGAVLIDIDELLKQRIQEGKSKTYDNLEISNIKVFFKGNKIDNYAILKIITK